MEIVSPILHGPAGLQEVYRVLSEISAGRFPPKSNVSAGFHVHVGKTHTTWTVQELARIAHAFVKYEEVFTSLVPRSRRPGMNKYVRSNRRNAIMEALNNRQVHDALLDVERSQNLGCLVDLMCPAGPDDPQGRYYALNFRPVTKYGTIGKIATH